MKIYITRHSLTAWNEEKRLQGWKDSPLTKQGKEDALKLGEYMKTIHIDQVYSSPLLRAKSTARLIFKNENIIEDSRLKEMNFGDWEGKTTQWIYEHHPEELAKFWETPTYYTPPDAEPITDFHQRIEKSHIEIQQRMQQHQFKKALVITHGGVIKMFKLMTQKQPLDDILKMSAELGQLVSFKTNEQNQIIWEQQQ